MSKYVESKSGIFFDAHDCKVTRVDFTRDFQVGENAVIPIIAQFAPQKISRYTRTCIDDTTVYFKNAGKEKTKQFQIYSKYHERLANGKDAAEQEKAKGLIKLESSLRKSAVRRLVNTLKLPGNRVFYFNHKFHLVKIACYFLGKVIVSPSLLISRCLVVPSTTLGGATSSPVS